MEQRLFLPSGYEFYEKSYAHCCDEIAQRIVVYDYIEKETLDDIPIQFCDVNAGYYTYLDKEDCYENGFPKIKLVENHSLALLVKPYINPSDLLILN